MTRVTLSRQKLRFTLGMQIAGVGFSIGVLWQQGVTWLAVIAVAITTANRMRNPR